MYANHTFYETILKIKSVYDTLLREKNVSLFGVGIIGDIGFALELFHDTIVFDRLMPKNIDD